MLSKKEIERLRSFACERLYGPGITTIREIVPRKNPKNALQEIAEYRDYLREHPKLRFLFFD